MKASEMTPRQRKALSAVRKAARNIAAFENTLLDYPPESEEYKNAKGFLLNGEAIKHEIYNRNFSHLSNKMS